jgi:hypothetical protein
MVKQSFREDETAFIEAIPGIVFAVVISYVYLNVGSYMNGTLGAELESTFASNDASGSIDVDHWHNASSNATRTVTFTGYANQLHQTTTNIYIRANGTFGIYYNLTVNGVLVNSTSELTAGEGYNWTLSALITAGAVFNANQSINVAWDVNSSESQIQIRVYGNYHLTDDWRSSIENNTVNTLGNLSDHFDDNVDIIKIAITISVLLVPIMTIMTLRRYT